jgi:hypothetical protein
MTHDTNDERETTLTGDNKKTAKIDGCQGSQWSAPMREPTQNSPKVFPAVIGRTSNVATLLH